MLDINSYQKNVNQNNNEMTPNTQHHMRYQKRKTIDESPMAYKDTNEIKDLIQETYKIKFMMIPKINIKAADGGD